jgi:lysophospholipase L1-like esterase
MGERNPTPFQTPATIWPVTPVSNRFRKDSSLSEQNSSLSPVTRTGARIVFGTVLAVVLLECLLRFYNPIQTRVKGNRIVLPANAQVRFPNNVIRQLDPIITVSYNSLGFRGPEPPRDFGNSLTIVVVGSSTAECFMLSDNQTWPDRLSTLLGRSFRDVWIGNAGKDGHSTIAHVILMDDIVAGLHPKVVLFLVGEADVARDRMSRFEAENIKGSLRFDSAKIFLQSLSAHSEIAAAFVALYRSLTAFQAGLIHSYIDLGAAGEIAIPGDRVREYVATYAKPYYLTAYEARLKRLIDSARFAGALPIFITQPSLAGPAVDDVTKVDLARVKYMEGISGEMAWELLEAYNDVTRRVARENGVPLIDLAEQMPRSSRYFYDFYHFTNQGAQASAEIIYRSLGPILAEQFKSYVNGGMR